LQGNRKWLWRTVRVLPILGVGAAYYMYKKRLESNQLVSPAEFHQRQSEAIQNALTDASTVRKQSLVLYQYQTCPFCNKVKAFLNSQNLGYSVVEVDPLFKTEIKASGFQKVPQLRFGESGPTLVDSAQITDYLAPLFLEQSAIEDNDVPKWRAWGNDVLARYLVINTNRSWKESFEGYDYVQNIHDISFARKWTIKMVGGFTMHLVSEFITKKRLEPYGYKKGQDEREALYTELSHWGTNLSEGDFLHGGTKPDLADIEIYGILQSVRSFPVYQEVIENCGVVANWMEKMDGEIKK